MWRGHLASVVAGNLFLSVVIAVTGCGEKDAVKNPVPETAAVPASQTSNSTAIEPGSNAYKADSTVLARVGERTIELGEFKAEIMNLPGGKHRLNRPGGAQAELERLIDFMVMEEELKRRDFDKDPTYHGRLAAIRAQAAYQERELQQKTLYEQVMREVRPTEEELRHYYDSVKQRFLTNRLHLRRIVVEDQETAKAIKQRIEAGEDFGKVAVEVNSDAELRAKGGDLGALSLAQIPTELRGEASLIRTPGGVSEPFPTQGKWNLLQLVNRENAPQDFAEVRPQLEYELKQSMATAAFQRLIQERRQALGVDINESALTQLQPSAGSSPIRPTVRMSDLRPNAREAEPIDKGQQKVLEPKSMPATVLEPKLKPAEPATP